MIVKLTARTVDSIKPTPGKRVEYVDADVPGLALRVTPAGAKSWRVFYRHRRRAASSDARVCGGAIPADARGRARDELYAAGKGADPAADKRQARKAETIADLAGIYIEQYAKRRKRSWKEDDRILRREILPAWKHRAIADIKRRECTDARGGDRGARGRHYGEPDGRAPLEALSLRARPGYSTPVRPCRSHVRRQRRSAIAYEGRRNQIPVAVL